MNQSSPFKGKTGIKRILNATSYSIAGFKAAFSNAEAFRQIVWINIILIRISFFVGVSRVEQALLICACPRILPFLSNTAPVWAYQIGNWICGGALPA